MFDCTFIKQFENKDRFIGPCRKQNINLFFITDFCINSQMTKSVGTSRFEPPSPPAVSAAAPSPKPIPSVSGPTASRSLLRNLENIANKFHHVRVMILPQRHYHYSQDIHQHFIKAVVFIMAEWSGQNCDSLEYKTIPSFSKRTDWTNDWNKKVPRPISESTLDPIRLLY